MDATSSSSMTLHSSCNDIASCPTARHSAGSRPRCLQNGWSLNPTPIVAILTPQPRQAACSAGWRPWRAPRRRRRCTTGPLAPPLALMPHCPMPPTSSASAPQVCTSPAMGRLSDRKFRSPGKRLRPAARRLLRLQRPLLHTATPHGESVPQAGVWCEQESTGTQQCGEEAPIAIATTDCRGSTMPRQRALRVQGLRCRLRSCLPSTSRRPKSPFRPLRPLRGARRRSSPVWTPPPWPSSASWTARPRLPTPPPCRWRRRTRRRCWASTSRAPALW